MSVRQIDGFKIWAGAKQSGDEPAIGLVELKKIDDSGETRIFQVITTCRFETLETAHGAASAVVNAVQRINSSGVPDSLVFAPEHGS